MIDTHGNVSMGKPRKGKQQLEYQKVKASIVEMLDAETPDREIAARIGISRSAFYGLKKRVLKEVIPKDIALTVAARQLMRDERQLMQLVKYMDTCYAANIAPEANYVAAYTNLSRRIADLVGANAAIAITIDHGDDDEATERIHDRQMEMARELNRFYELTDRLASHNGGGIGSGLTKEERDRELANLTAALPSGEEGQALADILANDMDSDDEDDPDIEDAIEVIEAEVFTDEDWDVGDEIVSVPRDPGRTTDNTMRYQRECAGSVGDQETPGRWIAGKFVSWWHDLGEVASVEDTFDYDMEPFENDTSHLDGPPDD